jgi:hypothetical protein
MDRQWRIMGVIRVWGWIDGHAVRVAILEAFLKLSRRIIRSERDWQNP